jgi:hypothetical protein
MWRNNEYSLLLPELRQRHEGQDLEFKQELPDKSDKICQAIAGFASTNAGIVLVGVGNNGELVGLADAQTPEGRDRIVGRIQGYCSTAISPPVTPSLAFAEENARIVLVIAVPRGDQPLYYVDGRPIVRHLAQSRRAQPDEVVERVRSWLNDRAPREDYRGQFVARLLRVLSDVQIFESEFEARRFNPWLDQIAYCYKDAAAHLRAYADENFSEQLTISAELRLLADSIEAIAEFRHVLNGDPDEFPNAHRTVVERLAATISKLQSSNPSITFDVTSLLPELQSRRNALLAFAARSKALHEGWKTEELKKGAADLGRSILRLTNHPYLIADARFEKLNRFAHALHLAETMTMHMDGGQSESKLFSEVTDSVKSCISAIDEILPLIE